MNIYNSIILHDVTYYRYPIMTIGAGQDKTIIHMVVLRFHVERERMRRRIIVIRVVVRLKPSSFYKYYLQHKSAV